MRVVGINSVPYGSTSKIMFSVLDTAKKYGWESLSTTGFSWVRCNRKDYFVTSGFAAKAVHMFLSRISGYHGVFSIVSTMRLIKRIKDSQADLIHLHNLHGWYINLPILFNYLKRKRIHVVWTLHDCWSFTGHCPHFSMIYCNKWKTGCFQCPQYRKYPQSYVDRSKIMWKMKKKWFTGLNDMVIVTPSQWLFSLVKQSYLKGYETKVINNGVNLSVFKPCYSSFRDDYKIENQFMILGVAFEWGNAKGLDVFVQLANELEDRYRIVLVGTDDYIDKILPKNIISIHRTQNQEELAKIYTAADVFVNPTREEVFGLVNVEALACGTPVVTFDTGGSPECIDSSCGFVVPYNNVEAMQNSIENICINQPFLEDACIKRANKFSAEKQNLEYIRLYEDCVKDEAIR